ncbi:hypothetical protein G7Z17_g2310 [Cylindrodendrum hubeiense]|uniref:Carboxylesterase type B domain-containing protein n=1 Tax=Cylindrodendrum hubeiense TaxID=595255 RepID=A0A9P5HGT1_9HYPO|nr:hypothetical protein G7Z17_g2310 [Cylindrodendrum hubeiense]
MRLLNSTSFELAEFTGDDIPTYAILSHTWESEEVTFRDVQRRHYQHLKGFSKLKGCCAQAAQDDLQWVWVDTCCIDRSSSAELSEAINSMYRWYATADVCYVYLCDVPPQDPFLDKHTFQGARWFTRGWCLQELIAPREVEFYADNWTELGTKWSLWQAISDITSIPASVLLQEKQLGDFPIAQRMSWASKRNTTREEDMAYCLLGIFDIHMPLLYGEGRKAFLRLQEEIMRRGVDYSIFLWTSSAFHETTGLLCDSPHYFPTEGVPIRSGGFCKYSDIVAAKGPIRKRPENTTLPEVTPRGLQMTVPITECEDGSRLAWIYLTHNDGFVCITLSLQLADYKYHRIRVGYVDIIGIEGRLEGFQPEYMYMALFTDLSIPRIPPNTLDFKLLLKSTPDENLSILDIYPECDLDPREDGSYGMQLNLEACPEFFIMVFGVERDSVTHRFVAALNMFHGSWSCKIRKFVPGVPLKKVAEDVWMRGPYEEECDRAISRLPSGTYMALFIFLTFAAHAISVLSAPCNGTFNRPSATIDAGIIVGTTTLLPSSTVNKFLGIPFGAPPVRFSPPQPPAPWQSVYDASEYKPACIQQFNYPDAARNATIKWFSTPGPPAGESEDCLNLNVFAPASGGEDSKAVLFWIFGGAFNFGTGSLPLYDGSSFATDHDVVVVTINYRNNVFGFPGSPDLAESEKNLGWLDQRLALNWVQTNIASFGGDPARVTIMGESSGAGGVDALLTAPPHPVPFHAAIMQSGQATIIGSNNNTATSWNLLAKAVNCSSDDLECVRDIPPLKLKHVMETLNLAFGPVKDGGVTWANTPRKRRLTSTEKKSLIARVPVLIGSNADEGRTYAFGYKDAEEFIGVTFPGASKEARQTLLGAYALGTPGISNEYDRVASIFSEFSFQCPAKFVGDESAAVGINTWRYYYNASFPNSEIFQGSGAYHSAEIAPIFGTFPKPGATDLQVNAATLARTAREAIAKSSQKGPSAPEPEGGEKKQGEAVQFDSSARIYSIILLVLTTCVTPLAYLESKPLWKAFGAVLITVFAIYIISIGLAISKGSLTAPEDSDSDSDDESSDSESARTSLSDEPLLEEQRQDGVLQYNSMPKSSPRRRNGRSLTYHVFQLTLGFLAICIAGYVLSHAATNIIDAIGASDVVFGMVFLAIATTLPEKFVAVISSQRGYSGILVANTVGSNIFLLSLCLGIIMLDTSGEFNSGGVNIYELGALWVSTLCFTLTVWVGAKFTRYIGAVMVLGYVAFIVLEFTVIHR